MIELINLILKDPLRGLLILIILFSLYLWREQAKIKIEIKSLERFLDGKKLDRDDFKTYNDTHEKLHDSFTDQLKMAIDFLKGGK